MRRWSALLSILILLAGREVYADSKAEARRYFQRGMSFIDQGRYKEGIEQLERAYEIRPHRNVLFNIARAYASLGRLKSAVEHFERYLAANPPDAERVRSTLNELKERLRLRRLVDEGMRAIKRKRYLEGIALLGRAYEARPHPNILFNIARAYENAGQYQRAIRAFEQYQSARPKERARLKKRLAGLRKKEARRRAEAVARRAPPPKAPPRRPPPSRRRRPRERVKETPKVEAPAAVPPQLTEEQLGELAAMIIEKMRTEGAFEKPQAAVPVGEPNPPPQLTTEVQPQGPQEGGAAAQTSTVGLGQEGVELEAKSGEVYENIVVTASRRAQSPLDAPNAVTILTDEDIRLSGAQNLPDLLRRVPGMDVMAMSFADYNLAMRGFNRRIANKILVLVDGRTAYQDFLGGMRWKMLMIDMNDIDRIEVVRGPGSAIYGAYAYTGVVNIITKRPEQYGGSVARASGGNGKRLEAAYQYGVRNGPVGVRVSAGFERADKYELEFDPARPDYSSAREAVNRGLQSLRGDVEAEYYLSGDRGRFYVGGGVISGEHEQYGIASLRNQYIDGQEYNVRAGYQSDWISARIFYNALRVDSSPQFFRTGTPNLGSTVRSDLVSIEPVFSPSFELLGKHQLVVGGDYRFKFIDWTYLLPKKSEHHFALFFQDSWRFNEQFSAILSGRLDLHPLIGPLGSPRAAVIYKPTKNQAIRLSAGTAFRQPTMAETYVNLSAASPTAGAAISLIGDQDLDPENIITVDVGYRFQADFGEFELVGYFNRVSNLIDRSPLQPTGPDQTFNEEIGGFVVAQSFYINRQEVFLAPGLELSTRIYPIDGLDVGASYSFQYIFNQDGGERFTDSPLHKVSLWAMLRTQFGLDVAASIHYTSKQDWIEPEFDPNDPGGFNTDPLRVDDAVVVIGRIGYRLFDDRLTLAVSGINLADFGGNRHREHPFANQVEARLLGTVRARF